MTVIIPPFGAYPGGFHAIDFSERLTNSGMEATISFEGPSIFRWDLVREFFPEWQITKSSTGSECCALLNNPPLPYPDHSVSIYDNDHWDCQSSAYNMWPETFTIGRGGPTCTPQRVPCATGGVLVTDRPLHFGNGLGDDCSCVIEINFRRKNHAAWPSNFFPCEDQSVWRLPIIPSGTYIDVNIDPSVQARTVPDQVHRFIPDEQYRKYDIANTGNCQSLTIAPANVPTQAFCNPEANLTTNAEIGLGTYIFTQEIEVLWSGVPILDWDAISSLEGRCNETVWLGHPPESIVLSHVRPTPRPHFGGIDLFDVRFVFSVMTAPVDVPTGIFTQEELVSRGIYRGRIGLWNRFWSKEPIHILKTGDEYCCTNWVPVRGETANCCGSANLKMHPAGCFDKLFTIPACEIP